MRPRSVCAGLAALAWLAVPAQSGSQVDLQTRLQEIRVHRTPQGDRVEIPGPAGAERLDPQEFVARLRDAQLRREHEGWLYRLLNITTPWGILWVSVGFLGQLLFTFRMLLQWLVSEKHQRSVVPVGFWWGSLFGGILLLVYFIWRKDIIGVAGQSTGAFIYVRNLVLIYRQPPGARAPTIGDDPAPEPELDR